MPRWLAQLKSVGRGTGTFAANRNTVPRKKKVQKKEVPKRGEERYETREVNHQWKSERFPRPSVPFQFADLQEKTAGNTHGPSYYTREKGGRK